MDTRLCRSVAIAFPPDEVAAAQAMLDAYTGNEAYRVKLAVLALAKGDLGELGRMMVAAQLDYRDVLYWAEYPEESGSMSKEEASELYRAIGVPPTGGRRRR